MLVGKRPARRGRPSRPPWKKGGEKCDDGGRWAIEELLDVRRGGARGTRLFVLARWAAPSARTQHIGVVKRRRTLPVPKWRPTPRLATVEAARAEERLKAEGFARSRKRKRALRLALVEGDEWFEHEHEHVHRKSRRIILCPSSLGTTTVYFSPGHSAGLF